MNAGSILDSFFLTNGEMCRIFLFLVQFTSPGLILVTKFLLTFFILFLFLVLPFFLSFTFVLFLLSNILLFLHLHRYHRIPSAKHRTPARFVDNVEREKARLQDASLAVPVESHFPLDSAAAVARLPGAARAGGSRQPAREGHQSLSLRSVSVHLSKLQGKFAAERTLMLAGGQERTDCSNWNRRQRDDSFQFTVGILVLVFLHILKFAGSSRPDRIGSRILLTSSNTEKANRRSKALMVTLTLYGRVCERGFRALMVCGKREFHLVACRP